MCVLDSAKCIYYGPRDEIEPYFASIGFRRPQERSITDFILSVTDRKIGKTAIVKDFEGKRPRTIAEFHESYIQSKQYRHVQLYLESRVDEKEKKMADAPPMLKKLLKRECLQSLTTQCKLLTRRQMKLTWNRTTALVTFISQILISFIIGSLFIRLPLTANGAYTRAGVLFIVATSAALGKLHGRTLLEELGKTRVFCFGGLRSYGFSFLCFLFGVASLLQGGVVGISEKFAEMKIFLKQREAGFYLPGPFQLAGIIDYAILQAPVTLVYAILVYFMCGLNLSDS